MSTTDRVQTVRNAWINRLREEALRTRRPEVSKAAHIGVWIATYADADGSNAFPSGATLAAIAGCTRETVTRCVKLLTAVGLLERRRRPNQSAVYQLTVPLGPVRWADHLHVWGESRQAVRRRKEKEEEIAEVLKGRKTSPDANREASGDAKQNGPEGVPGGIPEGVPGGAPGEGGRRPGTTPEDVPVRTPEGVPGGTYQYPPTSGRDPQPDHDSAHDSPQPQKRAGERTENADTPHLHLAETAPGTAASGPPGQRALLLSVHGGASSPYERLAEQMTEYYGVTVPQRHAAKVAAHVTAAAREQPRDVPTYVMAAVRRDPDRYRPTSLPPTVAERRAAGEA